MSSPAGLETPRVEPAPRPGVAWPDLPPGRAEPAGEPAPGRGGLAPRPLTGARIALALAAVMVLTVLLAKGGASRGAMTLTEIALTLLGAGTAAAAALAAPTPRRAWGGVTLLAFGALTTWTALSVIWAVAPDVSWDDANRAIAYLAVFAGAVGLARLFPWRAGSLLAAVLVASTTIGVIALALKAFPVALNSTQELARLRDPVDYWNALGLLAALAIPACLWLGARREGPPALRALAWPLLALAVVVVMLSYSRGVLIAVVVGLAFWFWLVPLRLRGLLVGLGALAGSVPLVVWAYTDDALSKDRVPLAERVSTGEDLALFVVLMVAVLFAAGVVANRRADTNPLSERARTRFGLGALATGAALLVAGAVALSVTGGGPIDRLDRAWENFFSKTSSTTTYGPERLKSIGTRRGSYWSEAEKVWSADPVLGAGAGGYAIARKRYREDPIEVQHAHGYVPQTAADLGAVGVGLSLLVLLAWIAAAARTLGSRGRVRAADLDPRRLARAPQAFSRAGAAMARVPAAARRIPATAGARAARLAPRGPVDGDRVALLSLAAIVVIFGVHSLIDWTWLVPGTAVIALVCAGFVAGRGPAGVPGPERTRPFGGRALLAASIAVAGLVAAWAIWQPLRAERGAESALAALEAGRSADARVQAQAAHERNPLALQPLFDLSEIEDAAGRKDQAQRALEQAVRLQPSNPSSWAQLASYQLNVLGQPTPAFKSARAALFLDPKSPAIQQLFLEAYRRLPRKPIEPGKKGAKSPGDAVAEQLGKLGRGNGGK